MSTFTFASEIDTETLARELSGVFRLGESIGLSGDLGSGKTTFVRYVIGAMGGNVAEVSSPSYTLQHEYHLPDNSVVEHWDLYRVRELPDDLREPPSSRVIRFLEWPERCAGLSDELDLQLKFSLNPDDTRNLTIIGVDVDERLIALNLGRRP
jgi:tRNA threonylcarbamoyladenosine biosynthesis protein TsaE